MANSAGAAACIARARTYFLETGAVPVVPVRHGIVQSWLRSRWSGVSCDDLDPPYFDDIDAEGSLERAAKPVLDQLEQTLSDAPVSVILTDARARVLDRRVPYGSLQRTLDHLRLLPGFSYAEEHVGTNGIGTARATRCLTFVDGSEHFTAPLHEMSCAAAPIRDRRSGRLVGLVDITCWSPGDGPLMSAVVCGAATDIEVRLMELGSRRQRTLLEEFRTAERYHGQAIVAVADDLVIANQRATSFMRPSDHSIVRDAVTELLRAGKERATDVVLSGGEPVTIRCHPVDEHSAVVRLSVMDTSRTRPRSRIRPADLKLAGTSPLFADVCAELAMHRQAFSNVLLEGEPGTGKLALARAVHYRYAPEKAFTVIEPTDDVAARCRADRGLSGGTAVFRHVELFTDSARAAVLDRLDAFAKDTDRVWVVVTTDVGAELPDEFLSRLPLTLTVPPLRHRIEDVQWLVPALLSTFPLARYVSCGPAAMRVLQCSSWPGNVAELAQVLRHALNRRRVGQIQPEDLPEPCYGRAGHVLSRWETIERDAIVGALLETRGDRAAAADLLGISRATVYRRISTYGITVESR
ncbi:Transcriptional regulator of acetoin/glycerol metabolism [Nonomuraea maritima]|uniref:Transcriptional regulator of acetoin/glycerol metabolism n=1 Tax=Nonomuraea maritima TaxID=683260 RepID=A0A1G9IMV9_9ACTN|nr:helix-turn-helix domain-containing protein [Nonomuraea maritima]SDL26501.1 Transcriptional regulator of acetoin/glycerol metabolism [Nonomuraea maritima]